MRRRVLPLLVAGALALSTVLFAAPVQAADTGTIEGKVNLPVGHTWDPYWYVYGSVTAFLVDGTSLDWGGYGEIQSDGTYSVTDLAFDQPYVVCATPINVDPSDLLTTCYGGYSTLWVTDLDSAMTPVVVPSVPGTVTNVDIDMVAAATISGTIFLPDGTAYPGGTLNYSDQISVFQVNGDGTLSPILTDVMDSDGSYSLSVEPGASYAIRANLHDYPDTWLGGRVGEEPTLPDPLVTVVTAPASGQTLSGQDITLAQGFSVSGTVNFVNLDPDNFYGEATACALGPGGTQIDCKYAEFDETGAYEINGLIPNVPFIVSAWVPGYSVTYYGGAFGRIGLPNDDVTEIVHPTPGGTVSDVNINMAELMTIAGSVLPASVWEDVSVFVCPVFSEDGQNYYRVRAGGAGIAPLGIMATALSPVDNGSADVGVLCTFWGFDYDTGLFNIEVDAGRDYVVIGVADGYTDVWYGGYVGDSGVPRWWEDAAVLPDSPLITLVSGAPGQTISNVDLVFGPVGPVTVTIVIDGVDTVIPVAPDGTVVLPTPAKAGFTFVGWFTDLNDPGSQFSASTPVTSDLTLYAKWAPTSVTPLGKVSSVNAVAVSGTGDPGSVVTVTFPGGATRTVTVGAAGTWSVPTPAGVLSGKVVVVITDPVTGATSTLTFDFKAPVAVLTGGSAAYPVGGLLVLIASGLSIVAGVALMRRSLVS